jgi:hypothetical protein
MADLNPHFQDIVNKAIAYQNALESSKLSIEENRKVWNAQTNHLITEIFQVIAQNVPNLNWEVKKIDGMENLDILMLGFKNESSGIVGQVQGVFKFFSKISGKLIYSQVYNSEVYVLIDYPHVEHHVERQTPKFLGKFLPAQITHDIVLDHINEFLEEMLNWESGTRKLIGFFNG